MLKGIELLFLIFASFPFGISSAFVFEITESAMSKRFVLSLGCAAHLTSIETTGPNSILAPKQLAIAASMKNLIDAKIPLHISSSKSECSLASGSPAPWNGGGIEGQHFKPTHGNVIAGFNLTTFDQMTKRKPASDLRNEKLLAVAIVTRAGRLDHANAS
jgi:hypothetical protein